MPISLYRFILLLAGSLATATLLAQSPFTRADTLRGSLRPERTAYDVVHYALDLELHLADSSISGSVRIIYRGTLAQNILQLDLDERLQLIRVEQAKAQLNFSRVADAVFVELARPTKIGVLDTLTVYYSGQPLKAINPPWDGGVTWARDSLGRPWIGVSCEGIGASKWWPTKDHLSDETDSVSFTMRVPNPLRAVSNGQLRSIVQGRNASTYSYATTYPINNYNITFYVGHYLTFSDTLRSPARAEPLLLNYAVLDYHLATAKQHFQQVKPMLRCYEDLLGPYPFWRDGYALIEAPYLGMEHQSAIAYGNNYMRGYRGGMIPDHMNWDYLIIHESGHEYFGNAISVADHAEMWLHESFTTYLEALYVECIYGYDEYRNYLNSQRGFIADQAPILGPTGVNFDGFGSSDHYFKGSWALHTFRTLVGDEAFLEFLRDFYQDHALGSVTTNDWLAAVVERFGTDYIPFWRQYLEKATSPRLQVQVRDDFTVAYFLDVIPGFKMKLQVGDKQITVTDQPQAFDVVAADWQQFDMSAYLINW